MLTLKKRTSTIFLLTFAFLIAPLAPLRSHATPVENPQYVPQPVRAQHGMVASTNRLASQVGVEIMKRGGNAVDAAVATGFALAVTYPAAGNLGGGGFMMIRFRDGRTTAIDYREMAPALATHNVYQDEKGNLIQGEGSSTVGYRAAGVPGTPAGLEMAWKKYGSGKLTWSQLIEPARRLAADGFPLYYSLARSLRSSEGFFEPYEDSRRIYNNNGDYYKEGAVWRQPELAATLARLQKSGAQEFYQGETARLIADDMKRHNGLITTEDMRNYVAKERVPLRSTYRGYEIISMPPPSSGGAVLIEMLNILEGYDLRKMDWSSPARYHLLTETMRRAFADRAEYMGDADFVKVPVAGLIDKEYAAQLRSTINMSRASKSSEVRAGKPTGYEAEETTHFTVVDTDGNVVSNTYTLNGGFGSGVIAKGTGVLMNNEMDDFAAKPGVPNAYGLIQGERNAVGPRKRPLSAMTPTFVLRKDGSLWFAVGSPGGPTIINTVLQVVINVIDYDMNIQQAIDAPRIHHQWLPDEIVYEPYKISLDTQRTLQSLGHKLVSNPRYLGDAQGIMIEEKTGTRLGASDPRNDGVPVGY
ncbi:MAG: gamma-glutamyltranspeptidase / glutathione hydrolase [Acidobacteriota bacterium]|jgi:gamma-glutamyltranspeptidase/glutathione hydrolase|nr:gamma-glutamyltranspeptidase / glutathione hydrolase [Acidobacteriota bacterium]